MPASSAGSTVKVSSTAPMSAKLNVSATGVKIFPSTRWNVKMGTKARMMMALEKSTGCAMPPMVWCRACTR